MSLNKIEELYNNASRYITKFDELIDVNREEAKKYLNLAKECQREADVLLGITHENK